ncbi:uncharacterized protein LOC130691350 [Daphnia carinata]|uniref:uncharacterized protein LOC130691350 n=1 Tax=Daphnia carinata TaxID=120202 RepID=UPI00257EB731|nr:uncharacterized protein LOC130691350 [Daphnia carinata]
MYSKQADNSRSAAAATNRLALGRNIEEFSPTEQVETPVIRGETPIVKRKPGCDGSNGKLFRACIQSEDGTAGRQYVYLTGNLGGKPKSSTDPKKREIFEGFYNYDVPVAIVKTMLVPGKQTKKEMEREFRILKELEVHENFIRYYSQEIDMNFVYLATELCLCSVADLLDRELGNKFYMNADILLKLPEKEILRQATRGLNYLHDNNFIHRNIKPNNFLIKKLDSSVKTDTDTNRTCRFVVKITDFRLARKYDPENDLKLSGSAASEGWEAPESKNTTKDLSKKLDVFILGCFYHYVLTARTGNKTPKHPFGDNDTQRRANMQVRNYSDYKKHYKFVLSETKEEKKMNEDLVKLIESMLNFEESARPTLQEILDKPYYNPSIDDSYAIYDYKIRGHCVIFNQQVFEEKKQNRGGSDKDRDALQDTFKKWGFETEVFNNVASVNLKTQISNLAKRNWKDYGCLVVCLLSHGVENAILCSDGRFVNINELKYEFSLNNCPSLCGKPKIFIVQACQVPLNETDWLSHIRDTFSFAFGKWQSPSTVRTPKAEINTNLEIKIRQDVLKYPPLMDFITIKAALAGFESYRLFQEKANNPAEITHLGSSFILALCKVLSEEYLDENSSCDLEDLLRRRVQGEINELSKQVEVWQTMQWETCLSKYLRFRKRKA